MDLDAIMPVENFSDLTIQALAERLAKTRTPEQCIYRETELDELWRLIDIAARSGEADGVRNLEQLTRMRDAVHVAHDLIGMDCKPAEAAEALRVALTA